MDKKDIIIAGAGPAGLTAGIYAARGGMTALIFDKTGPGGQMAFAADIENFPGFPEGVPGMELSGLMRRQAERFGAEIRTGEVLGLSPQDKLVKVETDSKAFGASAVILAVGSFPRRLGLPGESDFTGRGVSYCALCDGPFFSGLETAVIGGGDTAVHEALMLSRFAKKIRLIHRRKSLRAAKALQDRFFELKNAEFLPETTVTSINGKDRVESITARNKNTGDETDIPAGGVLIAAGYEPDTKFLRGAVPLDSGGYIIADSNFRTAADGVFACGDAVSGSIKQVVSACGAAAAAAVNAVEYVEKLTGRYYG